MAWDELAFTLFVLLTQHGRIRLGHLNPERLTKLTIDGPSHVILTIPNDVGGLVAVSVVTLLSVTTHTSHSAHPGVCRRL